MPNKGLQVSPSWRPDFSFKQRDLGLRELALLPEIEQAILAFYCNWFSTSWLSISDSFDCIHRAYLCWLLMVHCVLLTISSALCGPPSHYSDWSFIRIIVTTLLLIVKCHHLASIILPSSLLFSGFPIPCQHLPPSALAYREQSPLSVSFMLVPLSSVHP